MKMKVFASALAVLALAGVSFADAVKPADGTSMQIESVQKPGRLLRVEDARSADGTPIVLYYQQAWKCMTWQLDATGDGFRLKNLFTNKTFGPKESPKADVPVVQHPLAKDASADDAWKFEPIDEKESIYRIIHVASGLALEPSDTGNIMLRTPSDSPGQKWRLRAKPEHFTG